MCPYWEHHASKSHIKISSRWMGSSANNSLCSQGRANGPGAKGRVIPTENLEGCSQRYWASMHLLANHGIMHLLHMSTYCECKKKYIFLWMQNLPLNLRALFKIRICKALPFLLKFFVWMIKKTISFAKIF